MDGIEHAVDITAASLYEAVAIAVAGSDATMAGP